MREANMPWRGACCTCELQNLVLVRKISKGMLVLVSSHDAATIAKSTEAQAFKVVAKENTSTKASATMKATTVAKVVLEATACAARAGVHAKVKLQRKTTS
jgi:hypothetical protein